MEGDENYEDIEESRRDSPCNNRNIIFVSALKMIFVDNPKTKAALKDAVYVDAADTIDPENDGKTVIVCGTFELTKPAHDDELGLDFDSIRISSSKQTMKLTKSSSKKKEAMTDDEKKYGVLEWNSSFSSMPVSGQGKLEIMHFRRILLMILC